MVKDREWAGGLFEIGTQERPLTDRGWNEMRKPVLCLVGKGKGILGGGNCESKGAGVGMDLMCWNSKRPGWLEGGSEGPSEMRQTRSWKVLEGAGNGGGF